MKRIVITLIVLSLLVIAGCAQTKPQQAAVPKTPVPDSGTRPTASMNPISGPIQKSNMESAMSDARNCLSVLVMSLADEGIGTLDDGIVFVVEKNGAQYYFVYADGDLSYVENATKGVEITPDSSDWLENVRAYMP